MKQLIIALLFVAVIYGQNNFSGKIVDEQKLPLQDVIIKIDRVEKIFYSDKLGDFILPKNFNPNWKVTFSRLGYEEVSMKLSDLIPQKIIVMKTKVLVSQTVLIKASFGRKGETPLTFSELNKNKIRENYTYQDVPEMLSFLPSTSFYSEGGLFKVYFLR